MGKHMRKLICLLAMLAACSGDSTGPSNRVDGTWDLQAINGTLPYVIVSGTTTTSYTGSVLVIATNGTYNEILNYRQTSGSITTNGTITELGTWTATNGAITFVVAGNTGTYQGSVSGNTLTEIGAGITQVYRRR